MSNKLTLWAIMVTALVPIIAAFVMYFGQVGIPEGRTHHGQLVEPGLKAQNLGLPFNVDDSIWQVVLSKTSSCTACDKFENGLPNFYEAVGRERNRVNVSVVDTTGIQNAVDAIWIVDPLGNVVLRFDPEINPTLILKDLKKLLKLSKVG